MFLIIVVGFILNIIYDGIISSLQSNGGVTVYFKELLSRIPSEKLHLYDYENKLYDTERISYILKPRFLERFRDFSASELMVLARLGDTVFHSSYYRVPAINLPTVTTVHDFTYERFINGPAQWVHSWQKKRAIENSDIVICVSENTARDLQIYCPIPENKIRVIYNGVSRNYYPLNRLDIHSNEVVFVGTRGMYKNFHLAVQAVAKLKHLQLTIIGGGVLTDKELALLNHLLPGRYYYLGRLSDEALNEVYNRAYALLYPSSYEGFGIPILEAMRAGCPVVAVNVSSIPEVAGNAAVLVDSGNVNELVEGLQFIEYNRHNLVQRGFGQADKFSWDLCYQNTLCVYNELSK